MTMKRPMDPIEYQLLQRQYWHGEPKYDIGTSPDELANTGYIASNLPVEQFPQPTNYNTGLFDSFMKSWKEMPWMSTPGSTIQAPDGTKTFTPGIKGKFETLGGYGENVLKGLSLWQGIQGSRAQAENAKLYNTFMKDQLAAAQDARRFNNERNKVQYRLNSGESADTAYATLNNWRTV